VRLEVRSALALFVVLLGLTPVAPARAVVGSGDANWTLGGAPCRLIEVPAADASAPPIGVGPCPGVRPGAIVRSDAGRCTFNFLFTGSDGARYMGTAGHCILGDSPTGGDVGEEVWAPGTGPEARDGAGNRVGEFAYAVLEDPKDFGLIRLDPGVDANPQMCVFGGPTGINSDRPGLLAPVLLHHFGQGVGLGATVPGRSAAALGMPDPDHVYAEGIVVPGDSGSGIISADGRAVGVIVTVGVHLASIGSTGLDAGTVGVTRLAPQLERAEGVLGIDLTLETAPLN
jgi:hypothetical protein